MQKIVALATMACALCLMSGCTVVEIGLPVALQEELEEVFDIKNWKQFTFKALDEGEDLVITRVEPETITLANPTEKEADEVITQEKIETSKYEDKDFLIVAVYDKECLACDKQAPYYNSLSKVVSPFPFYNFTFTAVSLDESDEAKGQEWFFELPDTDMYAGENIQGCKGASFRIFTPSYLRPKPGSVYCINKRDAAHPTEIVDVFQLKAWANSTSPAEINYLYLQMAQNIADCVGTKLISFDASVSDWEEVTGGVTKAAARHIPEAKFEKNK